LAYLAGGRSTQGAGQGFALPAEMGRKLRGGEGGCLAAVSGKCFLPGGMKVTAITLWLLAGRRAGLCAGKRQNSSGRHWFLHGQWQLI
jgi:hypothetical protein